jgi:hypothetical protein
VNKPATFVVGVVLVLVVPWCFGLFSGQGFPIARFSKQLSFYKVYVVANENFLPEL